MAEPILSPQDVRKLANRGRVRPHARYHAHEHYLAFGDVVLALQRCQSVHPDLRRDAQGLRRHPVGFIAFGWRQARALRVDFDLEEDEAGAVRLS